MQTVDPVAIVETWQDAANKQNADRLVELSDPNIEIVGPRGSAHGHQILRDWLERAGLTLTTLRTFTRGDRVVLAQDGVWRSLETGEHTREATLASSFRVADGRVVQFARHDNLDDALVDAGLGEGDET